MFGAYIFFEGTLSWLYFTMIMEGREGNGYFLRLEEHKGPCMKKKKKNTKIECYKTQSVLEEFHDLNQQGKVFF